MWPQSNQIVRIVICFLCSMIGYEVLIRYGLPAGAGANQWENNKIRAERFFDADSIYPKVIVGSSLAQNLPVDEFGIANLGMAGGGPSTGLKLLLAKVPKPGILFVELDETVSRGTDDKLLTAVTNPINVFLRKILFATRTEYRPLGVAVSFIRRLATAKYTEIVEIDNSLRQRYIDRISMQEAKPISQDKVMDISRNCVAVREDILLLRRRGWTIYIFDIPRDSALSRTKMKESVDTIISSCLLEKGLDWLRLPDGVWKAQDGVHIAKPYSDEVAGYLAAFGR
jgi:hypothetical protein